MAVQKRISLTLEHFNPPRITLSMDVATNLINASRGKACSINLLECSHTSTKKDISSILHCGTVSWSVQGIRELNRKCQHLHFIKVYKIVFNYYLTVFYIQNPMWDLKHSIINTKSIFLVFFSGCSQQPGVLWAWWGWLNAGPRPLWWHAPTSW